MSHEELQKLEDEIRADIKALREKIDSLANSRFISTAKTKLDEAYHWVRDHFEEAYDTTRDEVVDLIDKFKGKEDA